MSYGDGWEFGDPCVECGEETSAEHRRYCDSCWREQEGWPSTDSGDSPSEPWRKPRPGPGEQPPSFVEGLARVRERLATLEEAALVACTEVERRLDVLERRVAQLQRGRAA